MDFLSFTIGAIAGVVVVAILLGMLPDGGSRDAGYPVPKGDVPLPPDWLPSPRPTNSRGSQPSIPANPNPPPKLQRAHSPLNLAPVVPRPWGEDGPTGRQTIGSVADDIHLPVPQRTDR